MNMNSKELEDLKKWWEDIPAADKKVDCHCPHCGRCPVCGKVLWPTPHGPEPCHPRRFWSSESGVYEDGMGLFVAID